MHSIRERSIYIRVHMVCTGTRGSTVEYVQYEYMNAYVPFVSTYGAPGRIYAIIW